MVHVLISAEILLQLARHVSTSFVSFLIVVAHGLILESHLLKLLVGCSGLGNVCEVRWMGNLIRGRGHEVHQGLHVCTACNTDLTSTQDVLFSQSESLLARRQHV